jgi:hypothetical protein
MSLIEYLNAICQPNVLDFVAEPTNIRKAWAATVSLYHFEDYLSAHRGISDKTGRKVLQFELETEFPLFQVIRDVANANKHFIFDRGRRSGLAATHSQIGKGAAFSDGAYFSDGSSFAEQGNVLRVEFKNVVIDLVLLCKNCLGYLQTKV